MQLLFSRCHLNRWRSTRELMTPTLEVQQMSLPPRWLRGSVTKASQLQVPRMNSIKVKGLYKCALQSSFAGKYSVMSCRLISS